LRALVGTIRARLGLSPEAFAGAVGASLSALRNWEAGSKRPHPKYLKRMAEMAPAFAVEIEQAIASYDWHPGAAAERRLEVPVEIEYRIRQVAKERRIDAGTILREALTAGLKSKFPSAPSAGSSTTERARRARETLEGVHDEHRQRKSRSIRPRKSGAA